MQAPRLFEGKPIALLGEFDSPTIEQLQGLLELGGAEVMYLHEGEIHEFSKDDGTVLVCDTTETTGRLSVAKLYNVCPVTSYWILDSISSFSLREEDQYYELEDDLPHDSPIYE